MNTTIPIRVIPLPLGETPQSTGYYALGLLRAYAEQWQEGILRQTFSFGTITPYGRDQIPNLLDQLMADPSPAIYLFTSFSWTHDINLEVAKTIRAFSPNSLMVFGGAHIPRQKAAARQFMENHPIVDIAVLGEGEETFSCTLHEVMKHIDKKGALTPIDLSEVPGLIYRDAQNDVHWTGQRDRIADLNSIPSPYLANVFDDSVYQLCIISETNRGCPFGCTFCDWGGSTLSKVRKYSMDRIKSELDFFSSKKSDYIFYCDANFGALKRDLEIADLLTDYKKRTGYPKKFHVSYAKNATDRVAYIVEKLYSQSMVERGTIAFQTRDQETLTNIDRGNIKTSSFESLLEIFKQKGIPISCDLLIGMPGQNYDKYADDLAYLFDTMVFPATYLVRVLPNAPMADPVYQKSHGMQLNPHGNVISTHSYNEAEWRRMIRLKFANDAIIQEGFLKYILYFLQVEHGIKASRIVNDLLNMTSEKGHYYPVLFHFMTHMLNWKLDTMPDFLHITWSPEQSRPVLDHLDDFYDDAFRFIQDNYHVLITTDEKYSLSALQKSIVQRPKRSLPDAIEVPHDVIAYFKQLQQVTNIQNLPEDFRRLACFEKSTVCTPSQIISKRPYIYTRPPADGLPNWPLKIEGLAF